MYCFVYTKRPFVFLQHLDLRLSGGFSYVKKHSKHWEKLYTKWKFCFIKNNFADKNGSSKTKTST